ncbi:MAG: hypothetical protein RBT74_16140 [Tenuifilaceae bacterium]|nr:hypothetical protein [Tenuifilaceae bacterium]
MNKLLSRVFSNMLLPAIMLISLNSCEYKFIEVDLPDPNITVSFQNNILPIFTASNNCTACHKSGSTAPDLTTDNAYSSIVPLLINYENPELSKIYAVPNPSSASHGFKKYTQVQAAQVLNWIVQGAENN